MKNIAIYYFSILLPIPLLITVGMERMNALFAALMLAYVVYRGFTDSKRLTDKGVILKKDMWKIFVVPFYSAMYMKELYFEK